jgi:2-octaprenyl-6-methoxyphenol hydroxylase
MKKNRHEIIICGSGMVGMTFALLLAKKKINVCLIDKNSSKNLSENSDSRTTAISQGSSRIYKEIGLWEKFSKEAEPILKILVGEGVNNDDLVFDNNEVREGPLGFIIDNNFFKKNLFKEVKRSEFITFNDNTEIIDIHNEDTDSSYISTNKGNIGFKLLVAADGRFSKTRFHANLKYKFHDYKQNAYVFNISHQHSHDGIALERFFPTGPLALLPMKSDNSKRSSVVWTVDAKYSEKESFEASFREEFKKRYQNFFGKINNISRAQKYPLNIFSCYEFFNKNVVLIGDACQAIHPIAGQGFNLGLRDAQCLSKLIFEFKEIGIEPFDKTLLRLYEKKRYVDKKILTESTHNLNKLFSNSNKATSFVRRLGIKLFAKSDLLKNQSMIFAMGLRNLEI